IDDGSVAGLSETISPLTDVVEVVSASGMASAFGAWERGLQVARGEHVLLCTDDIRFRTGWIDGLLARCHAEPGVAWSPSIAGHSTGPLDGAYGVCIMASRATLVSGANLEAGFAHECQLDSTVVATPAPV